MRPWGILRAEVRQRSKESKEARFGCQDLLVAPLGGRRVDRYTVNGSHGIVATLRGCEASPRRSRFEGARYGTFANPGTLLDLVTGVLTRNTWPWHRA